MKEVYEIRRFGVLYEIARYDRSWVAIDLVTHHRKVFHRWEEIMVARIDGMVKTPVFCYKDDFKHDTQVLEWFYGPNSACLLEITVHEGRVISLIVENGADEHELGEKMLPWFFL